MKPNISEVLRIFQMKKELDEMYEHLDNLVSDISLGYSTARYDYDLISAVVDADVADFAEELLQDGNFLKFEIVDNVERLQNGETVWKSVPFKPLSFEVRSLKTKPASLKE